ncbi:ATP-binding protein [Arenimonas sp.]|uniref:hybrid sensor histidine kinase/response regulator n=1 Tax=Arenimonas sp. TaxID=1872635 RepID=UPI0035AFE816
MLLAGLMLALLIAGSAGASASALEGLRAGPAAVVPAVSPFRLRGVADGLPSAGINGFAQDRAGYLWLATDDGLARFDGLAFRTWRRQPGEAGSLPGNRILAVAVLPDDRIEADVAGHGRWRLDRLRRGFRPVPGDGPAPTPAVRQWPDPGGGWWSAGPDGLAFRAAGRGPKHAWPAPRWPGPVRTLFTDREGGLWFAAEGQGLAYLPSSWRAFHFLPAPSGPRPLLAPAGPAAAWRADEHGLCRLLLATTTCEPVAVLPAWPPGPVQALLARADGSLWLAQGSSLSELRPDAAGGFRRLPRGGAAWPVRQLLASADGALWLRGGREVERRVAGQAPVRVASEGLLWLGPDGQAWRRQGRRLQHWPAAGDGFVDVPGAPDGDWQALASGAGSEVWLAGPGRLEQWRWQDGALRELALYGASQGVPAVDRLRLALDPEGRPWLATPRGLWRLDPGAGRLQRFGRADGLADQALGDGPLWVSDSGVGLAAAHAGWQLFDSQGLDRQAGQPAPLVLESVQLRRDGQPLALPADTSLLRLGPGDRELRLDARLVSFTEPAAHRFRFLLEGYDRNWVEVGADGSRVFPQLAPGSYALRVSGAVPHGDWSEPRSLTVLVDPPWWGTRTALAGSGLGLMAGLSVLAMVYRGRRRRRAAWQLARARQQLAEQHSEAKTRFLAALGHEIRTPMTGVLGMAELLQGSALDPEQRARVDAIQGAGRHLLRLVNDTLDLARIEAGKLVLEDAPFALRPLLAELAALLRPLAEAKGLAFHLHCDGDVPAGLRGDATRVRQILLNLASNAIKFCERGELVIHCGRRDPVGVVIRVRDTGPGLAADQQARLFRRFEQGAGVASGSRYGGSGLGLAISQELAAAMGGSISVRSEAGRGACFRVELPLPSSAATGPAEVAPVLRVPGRRVLLVEDDPVVATVVQDLLRQQGHAVEHAPHGLAAMTALETGDFDLALLDLDLPGLDGFQLARLLRARGETLPLLALTARADGDAEREALAAGMDGFLRKPVTGAMLAEALAQAPSPASVAGE